MKKFKCVVCGNLCTNEEASPMDMAKCFECNSFDSKYTQSNIESENYEPGRFETWGKDLQAVNDMMNINPKRVWTVIDDGKYTHICAGFHFVNRMSYIISDEEWENEDEIYLDCLDNSDNLDLPKVKESIQAIISYILTNEKKSFEESITDGLTNCELSHPYLHALNVVEKGKYKKVLERVEAIRSEFDL